MNDLNSFPDFDSIKIIFSDFDGIFTDNKVLIDEIGNEYVTCSRYDGIGLKKLAELNILFYVLTSETKPLAIQRSKKLGIVCFAGLKDKVLKAKELLSSHHLSFSDACFIGNDINDEELLKLVRLPIVTPDAHPSVINPCRFTTHANGGNGCIRELCDIISSKLDHKSQSHIN